jgi:hypothetical protein
MGYASVMREMPKVIRSAEHSRIKAAFDGVTEGNAGRMVAGVALVRDGFPDCGEITRRKHEIPEVLRLSVIFSPKTRKEKRSRRRLKETKTGAGNDPWRRRSWRQIIQGVRNHDRIRPIFLGAYTKGTVPRSGA